MYRGRKQNFDWAFSLKIADVIAIALSFPLTYWIWAGVVPPQDFIVSKRVRLLNCIFYGALILYFLSKFGLYRWKPFMRFSALAKRLPFALIASAATFIVARFLISEHRTLSYLPFLLIHVAVAFVVISVCRIIARVIDSRLLHGVSMEKIAFAGWSPRLDKVLKALTREMGAHQELAGFVHSSETPAGETAAKQGYQPIGKIADLEQIIEREEITLLVVDQSQLSPGNLKHIANVTADMMISLRMIPSTFDIRANRLRVRVIAGFPVMGINDLQHDRFGNRVMKRLLDIACALFGLAVSAPIIAVLAVLIKRESPGPIFFRQVRLGQNGKPFEIIKLRSMRIDAEQQSGAVWAVENDPRRLKIGAFMRKTNLDELPQFWNVLKGEMSMVGPRPERPEFVEDFRDTVRYYNLRHTLKPGVTGWAAVHGLRGNTSLEDRLEYDLYYIENWSLLLDIKIMFMTLAPPKNAY